MRHRLIPIPALALFLLIGLFPGRAVSTTVQHFGLDQLTANAERIFVGRCTAATPQLAHGQIYTRFEFDVEQVLKGVTSPSIEVTLVGGVLQGVDYRIVGMPAFRLGERVVLFLTERDDVGNAWPVGLGQGKFTIEEGPEDDPSARVRQSLSRSGAELLSLDGNAAAKIAAGRVEASRLHLADLLTLVSILVDADGGGGTDAR